MTEIVALLNNLMTHFQAFNFVVSLICHMGVPFSLSFTEFCLLQLDLYGVSV